MQNRNIYIWGEFQETKSKIIRCILKFSLDVSILLSTDINTSAIYMFILIQQSKSFSFVSISRRVLLRSENEVSINRERVLAIYSHKGWRHLQMKIWESSVNGSSAILQNHGHTKVREISQTFSFLSFSKGYATPSCSAVINCWWPPFCSIMSSFTCRSWTYLWTSASVSVLTRCLLYVGYQ